MTAIHQHVVIPNDHKLHIELELPADWPTGEAEITVSVAPARASNKPKAVEYLRGLSTLGGVQSIDNPSSWQQDIRQDRELPRKE